MTNKNPAPNRNRQSALLGIWLALTLVVGLACFAVLYFGASQLASTAPTETVPAPVTVTAAPPPSPAPTDPVDEPAGGGRDCAYPPEPASGFGYGIQPHALVPGVDPAPSMNIIRNQLGLYWVKLQVRWYTIESTPGQYDWSTLDNAMDASCLNNLRVMVSVVAAPVWTMANPMNADAGQEAPPDDFNVYADFLRQILTRYPGQIQSVEVWNEANLEREWNTAEGVSAARFAELQRISYEAIKAIDPTITVISGGPAPTGINCAGTSFPACEGGRVLVVDDASYLRQFAEAGGLDYTDCVGTHSNGTNLPPTADGANPPADRAAFTFTGPWDSPHYSWALKSQVETYLAILDQAGYSATPLCLTEFGYASPLDGVYPANYGFAADVTEQLQAEYIVQAYTYLRDTGRVKLAFLFNLNYGPLGGDPAEDDNTIFSLINKQGMPRPAFDAVGQMGKP
jgi:hypothetical protein